MPDQPPQLTTVGDRVAVRLEEFLAGELARWRQVDASLELGLRELRTLVLGGGKRLRPAFCHWSYVGAGGDPDDLLVLDVGAALEMLHAFALAHDDVMDGSDTRRGEPSVHRRYIERHAASGWTGEPRRVGEGAAILLGDLAHVYADALVVGLDRDAREIWNELRIELNIGQYLDIIGTASPLVDEGLARRIVRYKSGLYTIERPLHLGAALAKRLDLLEPLTRYGAPLGDAFQLRDDMLGAFGDPEVTGKPVGDDLVEGKSTPLLAAAHRRATPAQREVLDMIGGGLGEADIERIRSVLVDTGAVAQITAEVEKLTEQAIAALDDLELQPMATDALREMAHFVGTRQH